MELSQTGNGAVSTGNQGGANGCRAQGYLPVSVSGSPLDMVTFKAWGWREFLEPCKRGGQSGQ